MGAAVDIAGEATRVACVLADPRADVGDLLSELRDLGFVARCGRSTTTIASMSRAPSVLLVVGVGSRASAYARMSCAALNAHALLRRVPVVLVMPVSSVPIADPLLDAHELIVLPLRPGELLWRISRATAGRPSDAALHASVRAGRLRLDPGTGRAWVAETPIALTAREFALLHYFVRNPGRVHARTRLRDAVWCGEGNVDTRAVDVLVRRVRAKLGYDLGHCIRTVRCVGYAFTEVAAA